LLRSATIKNYNFKTPIDKSKMSRLFEFFIKRHLLANALTIMIILGGIYVALTINREEMPNTDTGTVLIKTTYPSASPEDVELNITNKIEDSLMDVLGIKSIISSSFENFSSINIVIAEEADEDETFREIQENIVSISDFPKDAGIPKVIQKNPALRSILEVGLTSPTLNYSELRSYASQFEKKLLEVPGVASISKSGYRNREVRIEVSPDKMVQFNVSMDDILQSIDSYNIRIAGGSLESYTSQKNVVTLAKFRDPMEVGEVILKTFSNGSVIKVKDVSLILDDFEEETLITKINGVTTISFNVVKHPNADIIRTVDEIKKFISKEKEVTNDSIQYLLSNDSSIGVFDKFEIVKNNGLMGLLLVLLVLAIFLNIRSAFWVSMGIPLSLLGVLLIFQVFNIDLDSLTMAAMVLVLGIIVDDAIVITENIFRHREKGASPLEAAVNGLKEVALPVFTTVATTALAFLPMFFINGKMGKFVVVIPLTVTIAMSVSIFESYFILPAHLMPGLKGKNGSRFGRNWFQPIRNNFEKALNKLLQLRYVWVFLALVILVITISYASSFKFVLFKKGKNTESINATIEMPIGTSLDATAKSVEKVEMIIDSLPENEINSYITTIGSGGFRTSLGPHLANIRINLEPGSKLTRSVQEISLEIRNKISAINDISIFSLGTKRKGPNTGEPIEVMIKGSDDILRNKLTEDVISFLNQFEGVTDIARDDKSGKEEIQIKLKNLSLARNGLTAKDVAQTIRTAYEGQVATSTRYGEEEVSFRVILKKQYRKDITYLKQLKIKNKNGKFINLEEVADFDVESGLYAWFHDGGERTFTITGSIAEDQITPLEIMDALRKRFSNTVKEYPGIRLDIGGEAQQSQEAITEILISFGFAALGIYFLLMLLFNSVSQPLIVILTIPFGIVGAILVFGLHGITQISFFAGIGFVGLGGVVVNDALVMVDHLNHLKQKTIKGTNLTKLIATGAADRLRPVTLTTITTVFGLLPLTYGIGGEDTMMGPMAMALGYGLLFATPIILILLPCLYMIREDINSLFSRISNKNT
jgi:multidrug efflux pump subunit AcrB